MNPREIPFQVKEHMKPLYQLVHWSTDMIGLGISLFTSGGPSHVVQCLEGDKCFHFTVPTATFTTVDEILEGLKTITHKESGVYCYPRIMLVRHPRWHELNMGLYEKIHDQCEKFNGTDYDKGELFVNHMRRRLGIDVPEDASNPEEWVCSSGIAHMWRVSGERWPGFADWGYGPDDYLRHGVVVFDTAKW